MMFDVTLKKENVSQCTVMTWILLLWNKLFFLNVHVHVWIACERAIIFLHLTQDETHSTRHVISCDICTAKVLFAHANSWSGFMDSLCLLCKQAHSLLAYNLNSLLFEKCKKRKKKVACKDKATKTPHIICWIVQHNSALAYRDSSAATTEEPHNMLLNLQ